MTLPTAGVQPTESELYPDPPFPPAVVEELMRSFVKAARAHQLYLPNNPVYRGAVDTLRASFAPVWAQADELTLTVTETELRWYGHPVLSEAGKSADSLPWIFFKDGIRELRFIPGFEGEELTKLLEILQRVRKASPDEDDLLTLLWTADFTALRYRYVELGLEPAAPLADGGERPPADAATLSQAAHAPLAESQPGVVNLADFDSTLYFLDEREIEYLQTEIRREYELDLRRVVIATLLDIFEQQPARELRAEVADHLDTVLLHLLAAGQLRTVAYLIREAQEASRRAPDITPEQRERLAQIPLRLSTPEALSQLLQALDEAAVLPPADEIGELFEQLRPGALGTVFAWLPRLQNAQLRPMLERAAERLASANTNELARLILSEDAMVAAEAIRRAGGLKTAAAVAPLGKIMEVGAVALRQLAVQALNEIGSPGALQALERALEDEDRDVRVMTARALAARAYRPALARVERAVKGKPLRGADLTEKMAMFEAFGVLCGDGGVGYLDELLNGRGFLGRREDGELRACAAMALGRVGTARAAEALRRASGDEKDVVVRNAVNRALRGGGAA